MIVPTKLHIPRSRMPTVPRPRLSSGSFVWDDFHHIHAETITNNIIYLSDRDADIPPWAKGAVAAMRQLGLIEGRGGNRCAPNDTATRAEAAVIALRTMPLLRETHP